MKIRLTVIAAVATLLSSIGLHPLFTGADWIWDGLGAILTVAGAGLLGRRLRLSATLCLLVSSACLFLYVTLAFTAHQALLGLIPTPSSVAELGSLIAKGWDTADHYAAPVPLNQGVSLLATLGISLVALVVDFLAVRLRRAAPAGLPLLAMYSVPAAVHEESIGWIAFILGAAGFMTLLLADAQDHVSGWGRHVYSARWVEEPDNPVQTVTDDRPDSSALAASGRRIGLAALTLAVALPIVIPGIHPKGLFGLGGNGTGNGPGNGTTNQILTPNGLVSMHRQLLQPGSDIVLTYKSNDPGAQPDYLRIYALDHFDGEEWRQNPFSTTPKDKIGDKALPTPPGLSAGTPHTMVTTHIAIGKHTKGVTFLPMPYAPTRVQISGEWRVNYPSLMVFTMAKSTDVKDYTVTSLRALPTAQQLQASAIDSYQSTLQDSTVVPDTVPKSIRDEARRVVRQAHAFTPYQEAIALERYFTTTGGFTYSLGAPEPTNVSDLENFILHQKTGYCEQFASSMALMARVLGIPARVAVGYTQGTKEGDHWVVRTRDAHAWPELYFEGAGWIRFEPTPTGDEGIGGQGSATVPSYAEVPDNSRGGNIGGPNTPNGPQPGASPTTGVRGHHLNEPDGPAGAVPVPKTKSGLPWGWISGGALVVLLLAIPMAVRLVTRRRRWSVRSAAASAAAGDDGPRDPRTSGRTARQPAGADPSETAHAAWAELRADAIDHGLPWRSTETPRATARRLSQLLELSSAATGALERISVAEERARYATSPAPSDTLRADVRTMREAFAAAVSRSARLRARLAPPTAMESLRSAGTQAMTALDQQATRLRALFHLKRP